MTDHPMSDQDWTALEAAAFRRLINHLKDRPEVQNIELMTLAGFCRNCLADWMTEASTGTETPIDKDSARAHIYGMPYAEWKEKHQKPATPEQMAAFEAAQVAKKTG